MFADYLLRIPAAIWQNAAVPAEIWRGTERFAERDARTRPTALD
jgi:hypothetical protein